MKNTTEIYRLIELGLHQELNPQQQMELERWIQSSPENLADYNAYKKLLSYSDRLKAMKKIDISGDHNKLKSKLKFRSNRRKLLLTFQRAAAILVIPLLIYSGWSISEDLFQKHSKTALNTTETTYGVRTQIELSDGTHVWLNSGSKLIYPEKFRGKQREVKLTGEAYFEVESDHTHPFYVDLGGYKIKATGTKFNISNYADANNMSTYLKHGVVSLVSFKNGKEIKYGQLQPGELATLNKDNNQFNIHKADGRKFLGWIDGKLVFDKDPMADVAARLGRWYNAEVIVKDVQLNDYVFTATFEHESLEEALDLLSYSSPIKCQIIPSRQLDDKTYSKRKVIILKR